MLVTGASSGVGAHLVRHFAALGWKVAALARRKDKLEEVCAPSGFGQKSSAVPFACDVSDRSAVQATVAAVLERFGHIDVLVNNAAGAHDGKNFWELPIEDIDKVIDVNLKGTMYVTHCVLRDMVRRNEGRIIAISSVAGTHGIPQESCYVASKHGMTGFMDVIANETRSTNICVSTLCPGGIDTPWWTKDHPYGGDKSHSDGTTSDLIQTQEFVDIIEHQLRQPTNRVWRRMIFFPKGEWH
eukprot:gnl/TRDRNA2_/TRDRNA2_41572_c0_seq1.p1 gnl/TRDRNA2_/TRDRNA2_41572_c0~~gnl/TRDRNA2_/TRDRNA2_41572_c0_seq1.p1  ORF type:complete len:281 (+),score=40.26 gnl/TRDRNA2_/TRDRNA2_41572_c0_seq1:119-844(+)